MNAWIATLLSTGLVSVTPAGTSGDADSGQIAWSSSGSDSFTPSGRTISSNGRFVVFQSAADDLVAGDTNGALDVFLRDLVLGTTERVSVDPSGGELHGWSCAPSISPSGRFVAFVSGAPDIVAGPTSGWQVYLRDLRSGTTVRVSVNASGIEGDRDAGILEWHPGGPSNYFTGAVSVADDGRVAFVSRSTNLVPNATSANVHVFVHDAAAGTTMLASADAAGNEGNDWSGGEAVHGGVGATYTGLSLSGNGLFVAFASRASNLDPLDPDTVTDVYVHDLLTGTTTCVSVNGLGRKGNSVSSMPSISYDGRYVAFQSFANNLVPGDTNGASDVFCRDRVGGGIVRVTVDSSGAQAALGGMNPEISARGRFVAFESASDDLVGGDSNGIIDIFVHDLQTGITSRRSMGARRNSLTAACRAPSLSDGARCVVFTTAIPMTTSDTNGRWDVFVNK